MDDAKQPPTYPQRLLRILVQRGMTQEQIAAALDIKQSSVSRMLTGKTADPRWDVMDRLRALVMAKETAE